jgi:hypothetical protein
VLDRLGPLLLGSLCSHAVRPPLLVKIAPDLTPEERHDIAQVAIDSSFDGPIVANTIVEHQPGLVSRHAREAGGRNSRPLFAPSMVPLERCVSAGPRALAADRRRGRWQRRRRLRKDPRGRPWSSQAPSSSAASNHGLPFCFGTTVSVRSPSWSAPVVTPCRRQGPPNSATIRLQGKRGFPSLRRSVANRRWRERIGRRGRGLDKAAGCRSRCRCRCGFYEARCRRLARA